MTAKIRPEFLRTAAKATSAIPAGVQSAKRINSYTMLGGGIPLFGRAAVQVIETQPVSIHGDVYFDCIVRILKEEDLEAKAQAAEQDLDGPEEAADSAEVEDGDSVRIGEWTIRQPPYQLRIPQHICHREPVVGDVLDILFIAQQPNEVEFLTE